MVKTDLGGPPLQNRVTLELQLAPQWSSGVTLLSKLGMTSVKVERSTIMARLASLRAG